MADLFDTFTGSSGDLVGHTSDSGDLWGPTSDVDGISLNGTGSVSLTGTWSDAKMPYSGWTPPGTDYSVKVTVGASWRAIATTCAIGPAIRCSGAENAVTSYYCQIYDGGSGSDVVYIIRYTDSTGSSIASGNLPNRIQTGDVIELQAQGTGATVSLAVLINGTSVLTGGDTNSGRITTAGSAGLRITGSGAGTDIIRTLWAGAIGGPSESIDPSSASVELGDTQAFTAGGTLPNEAIGWSAGTGSVSPGTGTSTTYTAPGSGSSDTATWMSTDLPTHFATAAITLTPTPTPTPTPSKGGPGRSPRRRILTLAKRLDFPLPTRPTDKRE